MMSRDELKALTELARWCLMKSLDARVDPARRTSLLEMGERLSDHALKLAAKRFDGDTPTFAQARAKLDEATDSVKARGDDLDALDDTLAKVAVAARAADRLLGVIT
jgi:ABC-type transporter Mla subunit MlaD